MSALRECPFCGRSPRVSWSRDNEVVNIRCEGWAYDCLGAGANCHDEAAAIAAWNRRAGDAVAEALRARVRRLEGALRECANDLEAYVMREYSGSILTPGNALRRARDLAPVDEARAVLEDRT